MKYSKQELKEMAMEYLDHQRNNDPKCNFLLIFMAINTGMNNTQVEWKIQELALWEEEKKEEPVETTEENK